MKLKRKADKPVEPEPIRARLIPTGEYWTEGCLDEDNCPYLDFPAKLVIHMSSDAFDESTLETWTRVSPGTITRTFEAGEFIDTVITMKGGGTYPVKYDRLPLEGEKYNHEFDEMWVENKDTKPSDDWGVVTDDNVFSAEGTHEFRVTFTDPTHVFTSSDWTCTMGEIVKVIREDARNWRIHYKHKEFECPKAEHIGRICFSYHDARFFHVKGTEHIFDGSFVRMFQRVLDEEEE